jgi:hypothetical protein
MARLPGSLRREIQLLGVLLVCSLPLFSLAGTPAVQTYDQLKALFDQGQYQQMLPQLNRTLADKASIAKPDAHYALLVLKGEAMLQMKASDSASDAFRAASLAGADDKSTQIARATVTLIGKSSALKYQPKAKAEDKKSAQPSISILSSSDRKQAFAALFTDMQAVDAPVVTSAVQSSSLPSIAAAARQVDALRDVEVAATDSDAQSKELLQKLATRASDLMNTALKPMSGEITAVEKAAAKARAAFRGRGSAALTAAAMYPQNSQKLDGIVDEAREISSAAAQMQPLVGDAGDFKTIQSDADKIVKDANALLAKYDQPTE